MSLSYHETSYVGTGHAIQAKLTCVAPVLLCTGHCTVLCKVYRQDKKQQSAGKHRPSLYFLIVLITKLRHSVNV